MQTPQLDVHTRTKIVHISSFILVVNAMVMAFLRYGYLLHLDFMYLTPVLTLPFLNFFLSVVYQEDLFPVNRVLYTVTILSGLCLAKRFLLCLPQISESTGVAFMFSVTYFLMQHEIMKLLDK